MSQIKIYVTRQVRTPNWLKTHPREKYRCDIFPGDGTDFHGLGETKAAAITNAGMAYLTHEQSLKDQIAKTLTTCASGMDGECYHDLCPQNRDGEPGKTGRSCPIYDWDGDQR